MTKMTKLVSIEAGDTGSERRITISAIVGVQHSFTKTDGEMFVNMLNDLSEVAYGGGRSSGKTEEPEAETRRPRRHKDEAPEQAEPEEDAEPKQRRRRSASKDEGPEEDAEPKGRRRRAAKDEDEAPKEEGTRRRRRSAEEAGAPKGPTYADVSKAATRAAQELGAKVAAEIIGDYSDTGNVKDIPAAEWQKFIDEVEFECSDDDGK